MGCSAIADTKVLTAYFLDMYTTHHMQKDYTLKCCQIEKKDITALNIILQNFKIKNIIITPHILSEFINRLRNYAKHDYKDIEREGMKDLLRFIEVQIDKDEILNHEKFLDFGNDISLVIASKKKIEDMKNLIVISFDGRFINEFYENVKNILAFDMNTLSYFF